MSLHVVNNPNKFQKTIEEKFGFTIWEQVYFISDVCEKVKKMGMPIKDCSINNIFVDSVSPEFDRREYCLKNCGFKCIVTLEQ